MNAESDQQLLRDYAESRRESAFAELVRRHVDLVYSAALRMVHDAHLAQDVTQGVFVALAGRAPHLVKHPVLSGWLHCTAQNLAAKTVRSAVRRRLREQEAAVMNELPSNESETSWENIAPQLDAALGELSAADRDVLLLRYFEKKSAAEMAGILGVSNEAAQKRVTRATERLREVFARRGVVAAASGLVVVITANAVQAAPTGLAAAAAAAALAGTALTTSTAVTITKTIAMTTLQKTIAFGAAAVLAGAIVYESHRAAEWKSRALALAQQPAPARTVSNADIVAGWQGKAALLAAQNAELGRAFDSVNAQKQDLEKQLDRARRSAALFRELASQANPDPSQTNTYPSEQHVFLAMGKKFRQLAELKNQDTTGLTKEQKDANDAALMSQLTELLGLVSTLKQFDNASPSPATSSKANMGTCLLYGALDLNDQQFGQVYNLLAKYRDQADQQNLLNDETPGNTAALKQLDAQAKAELQGIFSAEQSRIFGEISPGLDLVKGNFNFNL